MEELLIMHTLIQKGRINSSNFMLFKNFDFNAAISSCNGFLTASSSSVLQALMLGVKAGIIDKFDNGHYDYLVNYKACRLINSEESLQSFLEGKKLEISDEALAYCGLKDENINFNLGEHLIKCYEEFHAN